MVFPLLFSILNMENNQHRIVLVSKTNHPDRSVAVQMFGNRHDFNAVDIDMLGLLDEPSHSVGNVFRLNGMGISIESFYPFFISL